MQILLQNYIQIRISDLLKEKDGATCFASLKNMLTYKNPKWISAIKLGFSPFGIDKYLRQYHVLGDEIYIYRGTLNDVLKLFAKFKIKVTVRDFTHTSERVKIIRKAKWDMMPTQQALFEELIEKIENEGIHQGIALADTSFGKSYWMLNVANYLSQSVMILCHSTTVQKQWIHEEIVQNIGVPLSEIGGAGGYFKKPVVKNINVALYHSMSKKHINALFKKKIGFVAIDEVQKAAITQMQDAINPFRAKYRFGMSASIDRKDGTRFMVEGLVGPVVVEAAPEESDSKVRAKIFKTMTGWGPLEATDHVGIISEAARDPERNRRICRSAIREVKQGKIVLIFVERKEQAAVLAKLLSKFRTHLLIGLVSPKEIYELDISDRAKDYLLNNDPNKALEDVKALAMNRDLDIVIATQKAEVGMSIETFNHEIITTPMGKDIERFHQAKGRVERKHKEARLKKFGEKEIPTVEIMVDNEDGSIRAWDLIEETYEDDIIKNPYLKREE